MTPRAISHRRAAGTLELEWPDGTRQALPETMLRQSCRCAGCIAERRRTQRAPVVADGIRLTGIEPVGAYAVQLIFSDGHQRGIYPWPYLKSL